MNIRAVIFDIYDTLLERAPRPKDAALRWEELWQRMLGSSAPVSLEEFAGQCDELVQQEHGLARALGVMYPEVLWSEIVAQARTELASLTTEQREEFVFQHTQLRHTARLMVGAAPVLKALKDDCLVLGLASNAQSYTRRELERELASARLTLDLFHPALLLFSFEMGFSKPDPYFFRVLSTRLRLMAIAPAETLFVGNRPENDLAPSRGQGWRTWQLTNSLSDPERGVGGWSELGQWLSSAVSAHSG